LKVTAVFVVTEEFALAPITAQAGHDLFKALTAKISEKWQRGTLIVTASALPLPWKAGVNRSTEPKKISPRAR